MPRKIRQLEADLLASGFVRLRNRGKGDHRWFEHPHHSDVPVTLDGQSGDDAKRYQEKQVREAIAIVMQREA